MRMHHGVIPSRDRGMMLVPGRGNVSVRSLEDRDHVLRAGERLRVRVCARHMAEQSQRAVRGALRDEGNVAHHEAPGAARNERSEGVAGDEGVEHRRVLDAKVRRYIESHAESLRSRAASWSAVPTLSHGPW